MVLSIQHTPTFGNVDISDKTNQLLSLLPESERQNLISQSQRIFLAAKKLFINPTNR